MGSRTVGWVEGEAAPGGSLKQREGVPGSGWSIATHHSLLFLERTVSEQAHLLRK